MHRLLIVASASLTLSLVTPVARESAEAYPRPARPAQAAVTPDELDRLLAPVALYPDQLLGQILICSQNPGNVDALNLFMGKNPNLKGTELQDAVLGQGLDASFVALALFPQVVKMMAEQLDWTTNLGVAFTSNRSAVFDSVQRLRKKASDVGTLKTTAQQEVETRTTSGGQQVIVIEPANPQVVYVPQYNTTTVYTQAPTTVVVQDNTAEVVAAGMIGFTAGIAMGAAFSNPYYYGPYGWHGGAYMYNDAWDDYYDAREDAREDWTDHREDIVEERGDRASDARDQRTDRQENRVDSRSDTQGQRTERQENRQENRPATQSTQRQQGSTSTQAATQRTGSSGSGEARGYTRGADQQARETGAAKSDAFSGYSSGRSEKSASQRGSQSRSSSRSRGGGGGGGRRR